MTSMQRNHSFAVLFALLFGGATLVGCSEKSASPSTPQSPSNKDGKDGDDTGDDTGDSDGGTDSGSDDGSGSTAAFDLCTAMEDKKSTIDGFSTYIDELCGKGDGQNKLPTLRKPENVYKGGDPILKKSTDNGDGTTVSVRLFTSTIVKAKATDYFALIRLQVVNPKAFADNYEHDDLIKLTDVNATGTSSSFHYQYSDGDGNVEYDATARFYTLKKSTAYISATKMDKSVETMKDLKGLIIVSQKDATHSEVFTMSDQTYEVANGQSPQVYDSRATEKAGLEQQRMFKNADSASKAAGLLKQ